MHFDHNWHSLETLARTVVSISIEWPFKALYNYAYLENAVSSSFPKLHFQNQKAQPVCDLRYVSRLKKALHTLKNTE